jgi:glycosyltransferase involved in cell wall biosynthesis
MKFFIKKIIHILPKQIRFSLFFVYENFYALKVRKFYSYINTQRPAKKIKNILFYHPSGLSFGGTEKFLQIIAKYLSTYTSYRIYFMYSDNLESKQGNTTSKNRRYYLENSALDFITFTYSKIQESYPFIIENMNPTIFKVIEEKNIDLLIVTGSGYSQFPINIIKDVPIIMLNIFGSPSSQKNIIQHVSISEEVAKKISIIVPPEKITVMYIPSEKPTNESGKVSVIRKRFNIKETDFVFGRIGRSSDDIFDPIAINAFEEMVVRYPQCHYLIMSAPQILKKIVEERNIPHVHFLEASSDESDIWAFHQSIDVLAHARKDGESCGLNIIESLLCGNPIITHQSHLWNAQMEYLKPHFSRVAEQNNSSQYAIFMKEMIDLKQNGAFPKLREEIKAYAEKLFLIENNIEKIDNIIQKYSK